MIGLKNRIRNWWRDKSDTVPQVCQCTIVEGFGVDNYGCRIHGPSS